MKKVEADLSGRYKNDVKIALKQKKEGRGERGEPTRIRPSGIGYALPSEGAGPWV